MTTCTVLQREEERKANTAVCAVTYKQAVKGADPVREAVMIQ